MAEVVNEDVVEQILIELDVKDLIRFKTVCKSWHSLITSHCFVNRHRIRSYNKDRNNNELGHRRITLFDDLTSGYDLFGSSNGLVCLISNSPYIIPNVFVGNPLTREVRQLKLPHSIGSLTCCGFGYDIFKDDYTVFVGAKKGKDQTRVQALSLKSNVWRVIADVKYNFLRICWFTSKAGILCNGALHWILTNKENEKDLVIAYDLSKQKFREIPQPDHPRYKCTFRGYLGIVKECLCISRRYNYYTVDDVWLMKSYNVKESWEHLSCDHDMKYDIVHGLSDNFSHLFFFNLSLG
ncbi:putative F-box domain, galactose oxidase/kelch, beta-propeller, F-box associated interaction [Helianthus annuus]|nr:putative F-box domain, galactose oxidase/kelch, beta-propeller, F-box associated interaction [Helianthus annuus]